MNKFIWLIIFLVIVISRTAEGGFNEISFADSLGINTGNILIGLGCAFVWWIITRKNLSANWKWFDALNAASYVMAILYILHLTVPKWVEAVSQDRQKSIAANNQVAYARFDKPVENYGQIPDKSPPAYKSAPLADPQPPEGFEFEQLPVAATPLRTTKAQGHDAQSDDWETRLRAWEVENTEFLKAEPHRVAVNRWIAEYGAVQSISNAELISLIENKASTEFGYSKAPAEPAQSVKSQAKSTESNGLKCQQQFFADIDKADQDMPLAEFAEYQQKAKQKQIKCNSR